MTAFAGVLQVITVCSAIEPPAASLWFLLLGWETDAGFEVEERAKGRTRSYDDAPFKSRRSNSSSKRSTSQHQQQQQHHGDEAFVSDSSWDDSDSDAGSAPKRKRHLSWYLFSEKHRASFPSFCYCSSEDESAAPDAEAAMQRAGDATDTSKWYSQELQRASKRGLGDVSRLHVREQEEQRQYLREQQQLYAQRVHYVQQVECLQRRHCKKLLKAQLAPGRFARDYRPCLRQGLSWHSAESCSASSSLDSSDGDLMSSSDSDPQALTGLRRRTAAATRAQVGASSSAATAGSVLNAGPLQQGGWLSQRRAARYDWGGCRHWHLERMRVLIQRQQVLHRVSELQAASDSALALLQGKQQKAAAAAAAAASRTWQQGSQQQHTTQPCSPSHSAAAAAAAMGRAAAPLVLRYTCGAAVPGALTVKLSDQQQTETLAPLQPLLGSAAPVSWPVEVSRAIEECRGRVQQAQQHVQELCSPEGQLLRELVTSRKQEQPADTAGALHSSSGGSGSSSDSNSSSSTRQLLWEVLQQLKPAACQWYEHGAQHYQQQQPGKSGNSKTASPTAVSTASSTAAASVPECCSVELWSTLCHSIAADLLLVPPSIQDMVGNGWAAGAGRLGDMGADIITTTTSSSSVAARMLVVQYARAARQKYAQVCSGVELGHLPGSMGRLPKLGPTVQNASVTCINPDQANSNCCICNLSTVHARGHHLKWRGGLPYIGSA